MCAVTTLSKNGPSPQVSSASKPNPDKLEVLQEQPDDLDQAIVDTPYGHGLVIRSRKCDGIKEIQLLDLTNFQKLRSDDDTDAIGTPPAKYRSSIRSERMLYTTVDYPSTAPRVGDDVVCQFGRGRIQECRVDCCGNNEQPVVKYAIELSSWRLRGRSSVLCYITTHTAPLRVVRKHTYSEMDAIEKVELARSRKAKATNYFTKTKDYSLALSTYASAVDALRNVSHDHTSTNEVRADLLLLLITCSNNAATCCFKLNKWDEASKFSQNALILIDALHEKRGKKIHSILNREGTIDAQLFGEWRVKSYLVMAHSSMEKDDNLLAMGILKKAHLIAMKYIDHINAILPNNRSKEETASCKSLISHIKDVRRVMSECSKKKKATKEIEKRRARAMFGGTSSDNTIQKDSTESEKNHKMKGARQQHRKPTVVDKCANVTTAISSIGRSSSPACKKSVSFSQCPPQVKEFEPFSSSNDDDDQEIHETWISQNKEALIVLAVAGFSTIALITLKKFAR